MRTLGQNPTDEEVVAMVAIIDVDGNGTVEFDEFVILMVQQLRKENAQEEELVNVFKIFDKDCDGLINHDDLINRFEELGDPITKDEAKEMMEVVDIDRDGNFCFTEFLKLMMYDTEDRTLIDQAAVKTK